MSPDSGKLSSSEDGGVASDDDADNAVAAGRSSGKRLSSSNRTSNCCASSATTRNNNNRWLHTASLDEEELEGLGRRRVLTLAATSDDAGRAETVENETLADDADEEEDEDNEKTPVALSRENSDVKDVGKVSAAGSRNFFLMRNFEFSEPCEFSEP